jgi:hypothetical protein
MRKLIVLLLIILTACSPKAENKEIKKEERVKVNNYSVPEEKKVPQEIEKDLGYAFTVLYDASCNRVNNITIKPMNENDHPQYCHLYGSNL